MDPENILKGKMAESLVEELLKRCKNRVYKISGNLVLETLEEFERTFSRESRIGQKLSSVPNFIISGKEKQLFIKVKFRTDPESLEEELLLEKEYLEKFWKAKIVLVTPKEKPYFRVISPPYFSKEKREGWPIPVLNWLPFEDDPELKISSKVVKEFEKLVEKYFCIEIKKT